MSRRILEITLHLPDGKTLNGRGRNLPATIERIYNGALSPVDQRHLTLVEHLKTGHVRQGEHRYQGTFHARFAKRGDPATPEETVVAEVREPA